MEGVGEDGKTEGEVFAWILRQQRSVKNEERLIARAWTYLVERRMDVVAYAEELDIEADGFLGVFSTYPMEEMAVGDASLRSDCFCNKYFPYWSSRP